MNLHSRIFTSVDAFKLHKVIFERRVDKSRSDYLRIRYFSIIDDLRILYEWKESPLYRSNILETMEPSFAIKHYRAVMLSTVGQVFVVVNKFQPVAIFEMLPAKVNPLSFEFSTDANDYVLQYHFCESHGLESAFEKYFKFFKEFLESTKSAIHIIIPVAETNSQVIKLAEANGFTKRKKIIINSNPHVILAFSLF